MPNRDASLDDAFRALADPTRRAVIQRLGRGPASVTDLAEPFEMALPSFLQHLKILEKSGLVRSTKVGRTRTCELSPEALAPLEGWLAEQKAMWEARFDRLDAVVRELQTKGDAT
ncbi:DNA-binding transcriptional ArsR family regulator [Amorphus suaedae]